MRSRYRRTARLLAAWPALLTVVLAIELRSSLRAGSRVVQLSWASLLGLSLSFNLDGLGLLFALLITAVGALVILYASEYLDGHPHAVRFLRVALRLGGRHAQRGAQRQHPHAVRFLGAEQASRPSCSSASNTSGKTHDRPLYRR